MYFPVFAGVPNAKPRDPAAVRADRRVRLALPQRARRAGGLQEGAAPPRGGGARLAAQEAPVLRHRPRDGRGAEGDGRLHSHLLLS